MTPLQRIIRYFELHCRQAISTCPLRVRAGLQGVQCWWPVGQAITRALTLNTALADTPAPHAGRGYLIAAGTWASHHQGLHHLHRSDEAWRQLLLGASVLQVDRLLYSLTRYTMLSACSLAWPLSLMLHNEVRFVQIVQETPSQSKAGKDCMPSYLSIVGGVC